MSFSIQDTFCKWLFRRCCWFAAMLLLPGLTKAQTTALKPQPPLTQRLSLQRSAAVFDEAADLYRRLLWDIVPTLEGLIEHHHHFSDPNQLLHHLQEVQALFRRSYEGLNHRFPDLALHPLLRAYHQQIIAALDHLASDTTTPPQLLKPLSVLQQALQGVLSQCQQIIAIYAHPREVVTDVISAEALLDKSNEALSELQHAEEHLALLRQRQANAAEQLTGFLRLEIALSHVLDCLADDQEAGMYLGFEGSTGPQLALQQHSEALAKHLSFLEKQLAELTQSPLEQSTSLESYWLYDQNNPQQKRAYIVAKVQKTHPAIVSIQLYRQLASYDQNDLQEAVLVTEFLPTQEDLFYIDTFEDATSSPASESKVEDVPKQLRYRLAMTNTLGVQSLLPWQSALFYPNNLWPAKNLQIKLVSPDLHAKNFYQMWDAIHLQWQLSPADPFNGGIFPLTREKTPLMALLQEKEGPAVAVRFYHLYRCIEQQTPCRWQYVSTRPAGSKEYYDRPAVQALQQGMRYRLQASDKVMSIWKNVSPEGAIFDTDTVYSLTLQNDLTAVRQLASHGASFYDETPWSQLQQKRYEAPSFCQKAFENLIQQSNAPAMLQSFWQHQHENTLKLWYQQLPQLYSEQQRQQYQKQLFQQLHRHQQQWFLRRLATEEDPQLAQDVERFWSLLSAAQRQKKINAWLHLHEDDYGQWLKVQKHLPVSQQAAHWQEPIKLFGYFEMRDEDEEEVLWQHFKALQPTQQIAAFEKFHKNLLPVERQSFDMPSWNNLSEAEKKHWLEQGPEELPWHLQPIFLAYRDWQDLALAEKLTIVTHHVTWYDACLATLLYTLRPLDLALDFKLPYILCFIMLSMTVIQLLPVAPRK